MSGMATFLSLLIFCLSINQPLEVHTATTMSDYARADDLYFHRNVGNNLEQSITFLKNKVAKHPKDVQALWRLGRSLEKRGEQEKDRKKKLDAFAEAEKVLKQSSALNPNLADAHFFLGITWGRIGQARGIMKSLFLVLPIRREMRKTLELDPKHSGAHHVLGEILLQTPAVAGGSKKGAIRELETALELGPNYTSVYTDLAEAYLAVKEPEKAKAVLRKIFTVKTPADPAEFGDDVKLAREMLAKLSHK